MATKSIRSMAFCLAFALSACTDSALPVPSETPLLSPGRYEVVLTAATAPGGALCSTISTGSPTMPDTSVAFTATAVADGTGGFTVRPDTAFDLGWTMTLRQSGETLSGTSQGAVRSITSITTATLDGGQSLSPAAITGRRGTAANSVSGSVTGRVVFSAGNGSYSCTQNEWRMTRLD